MSFFRPDVSGSHFFTSGEIHLASDKYFNAFEIVHTGVGYIGDHSGRCTQTYFLVRAVLIGYG